MCSKVRWKLEEKEEIPLCDRSKNYAGTINEIKMKVHKVVLPYQSQNFNLFYKEDETICIKFHKNIRVEEEKKVQI